MAITQPVFKHATAMQDIHTLAFNCVALVDTWPVRNWPVVLCCASLVIRTHSPLVGAPQVIKCQCTVVALSTWEHRYVMSNLQSCWRRMPSLHNVINSERHAWTICRSDLKFGAAMQITVSCSPMPFQPTLKLLHPAPLCCHTCIGSWSLQRSWCSE